MIRREKYEKKITDAFKLLPIAVLIGARQVGKTSIMKMYPTECFRNTLFLNGQDAEVAERFQKLSTIEQYLRVYLNEDMDGMLMIDEFQFISGISTMLKLLTDKHERLKILCSGSSSLDILRNVEESLAGRVRVIEVLSLSFSEYLLFRDEKLFRLQQTLADASDEALTSELLSGLSCLWRIASHRLDRSSRGENGTAQRHPPNLPAQRCEALCGQRAFRGVQQTAEIAGGSNW